MASDDQMYSSEYITDQWKGPNHLIWSIEAQFYVDKLKKLKKQIDIFIINKFWLVSSEHGLNNSYHLFIIKQYAKICLVWSRFAGKNLNMSNAFKFFSTKTNTNYIFIFNYLLSHLDIFKILSHHFFSLELLW